MITDDKFSQSLLATIKDKKISPTPRWHFFLRNIAIWTLGVLSLIFGAMAVSLIFYMQHFADLPLYQTIDADYFNAILVIVPFFWLASLAVFVALVYFNFKKTDNGYRYRPVYIVGVSIALSLILGYSFHAVGGSVVIDDWLSERAPYYDSLVNPHIRYWSDPIHGRLIGVVISEVDDNNFALVSPDQGDWQVYLESNQMPAPIFIIPGQPVRCLGQKLDDQKFLAHQVLPVMPGRRFFNRPAAACSRGCGRRIWQK